MKRNILLVIISLALSCVSCVELFDFVYFFKVQNNSTDIIQYYASYAYPDTAIAHEKPILNTVHPSECSSWESDKDFKDIIPSDTISVYIFSKDTVDKYSWDKIRSDYNILKRYDLSLKDLETQNWTVSYP